MAWLFGLAAEVGSDRQAAEALWQHYEGLVYEFPDGRRSRVVSTEGSIFQYDDGNFWCSILMSGASLGRPADPQIFETEEELTSLGHFLYNRLRSARGYRYAQVGLEVEVFRTFSELLEEGEALEKLEGLVLSEEIHDLLRRPGRFVPFSPGYYWNP